MSSHQTNQANPAVSGSYQYQWGDQVVEIPSNINYQLENVIGGGSVSIRVHIYSLSIFHINSLRSECMSFNKHHEPL
jgi:hypothetical protein